MGEGWGHCRTIWKPEEGAGFLVRAGHILPGIPDTWKLGGRTTSCLGMAENRCDPCLQDSAKGGEKKLGPLSPMWILETFEGELSCSWAWCPRARWLGGQELGPAQKDIGQSLCPDWGQRETLLSSVGVRSHQLAREASQSPAKSNMHKQTPLLAEATAASPLVPPFPALPASQTMHHERADHGPSLPPHTRSGAGVDCV